MLPSFSAAPSNEHPKQGLADMLIDYLVSRYPDQDLEGDILYVSVARQRLFHVRHGRMISEHLISTAAAGLGSEQDSYRTPEGLHRVAEKIGGDVPIGGVLKDREFTGEVADLKHPDATRDVITSRILWLEGLEPGSNQGGSVDSHDRYIYIHGTGDEGSLGRPSSMGCIRMRNRDVIALFDVVDIGTLVVVLNN
ncbi:MAG: L,D-transpeptidase [Flavobacteriales bacterium]|nr:L,D-transpeptidase [Flavobacteriales bacterium]